METTKHIVSKAPLKGTRVTDEFSNDREPFEHSQLQSVDNLIKEGPQDVAGKEKLYNLTQRVGMLNVLRWKPRLVREPILWEGRRMWHCLVQSLTISAFSPRPSSLPVSTW
jgi:hypothetical protein